MKYIVLFLGLLVSFVVSADPRIDHYQGTACHFPKDAANTDYEDKIDCPKSRLIGGPGGNVVAGYAIVKEKVPCDFLPPKIVVESDGANGNCNLVNNNNTPAAIADWKIKIRGTAKKQPNGKLVCTAVHEIRCGNPDEGYIE